MNDIEAIKAQLEIYTLKARHMRMLDTKDWAGYAELLTEDFTLDISEAANIPPIAGRDAALKLIQASIGTGKTVHQIHPPEFELHGDEAHVVWAMHDRTVRGPGEPSLRGYGHHHDRWVRRNGQWRLAAERLTRLHTDIISPAPAKPTPAK